MLDFLTKGETDVNSNGTIASAILLGTIGVFAFIVQLGLVQADDPHSRPRSCTG